MNENALRGLLRSPRVVSVIKDEPSPPALDTSMAVIGGDVVHTLGWDGSGLAVVILDTGIDRNHPFVSGRVVWEACFSSDGGNEESLCPNGNNEQFGPGAADINILNCMINGTNRCDHGMHVAGIAAGSGGGDPNAPAAGVAPGAFIIAMQVFTRITGGNACDPNPTPCVLSFASDQLAALEHLLDDIVGIVDVAAVNISIGGGMFTESCNDDSPLPDAMRDLRILGIPTIVSAGNSGFLDAVGMPACVSWALPVGATDNSDNVAMFSNRGLMLAFFAPGVQIFSSAENGGYEFKQGTSMAAPHVTGAWAVMRQAAPGATFNDIFFALNNTGVPITYQSGSQMVTTPRIDLAAALGATSQPPVLGADQAAVTVAEGGAAANTGTFSDPDGDPVTLAASIGTVTDAGGGTWSWSFGTTDGPAESQQVTITGTDDHGAETSIQFALTVDNVAPVVDAGPDAAIVSGDAFFLSGTFTDAGTIDFAWSWTIDWGDGAQDNGVTGTMAAGIGRTHQYCAAGGYTVSLGVTDKDGGAGSDALTLTVAYLDATLDVLPGSDRNPVGLKGNGMLPVAVLSTAAFDATTEIDPTTVLLGDEAGSDTPIAQRNHGTLFAAAEDVNGDGLPDLVMQFRIRDLVKNGDLTNTSTQLALRGVLGDGCTNFRGVDAVVVVP